MKVPLRAVAVLAVLSVCYLMVYLQRMGMAVAAPMLTTELRLGPEEMGLLGSVFLYAYASIQFFSGIMADHLGPRRVMLFFFGTACLGGALFASASSLPLIVVGRGLCGAGMAVVLSCSFVAFSRWFPRRQYARVCAIFFSLGGLGGLLATYPLAVLNDLFGWRGAYFSIALLCFGATVLLYLFVRDFPPAPPDAEEIGGAAKPPAGASLAAVGKNLAELGRSRWFWLLLLGNASLPGFYYAFVALWAGPFMADVYQMTPVEFGGILTMGAMGFLVGNPVITWLSEKVFKSHRWAVLLGCPLGAVSAILLAFYGGRLSVSALYAAVLCVGLAANGPNAVRYTITRHLLGSKVVGTVSGIYGCSVFITGASLQVLIGYLLKSGLAEGMSNGAAYSRAFSVFLVCVAVNIVVTWMLPETFPGKETAPAADFAPVKS